MSLSPAALETQWGSTSGDLQDRTMMATTPYKCMPRQQLKICGWRNATCSARRRLPSAVRRSWTTCGKLRSQGNKLDELIERQLPPSCLAASWTHDRLTAATSRLCVCVAHETVHSHPNLHPIPKESCEPGQKPRAETLSF